jgi:hypothetical protein
MGFFRIVGGLCLFSGLWMAFKWAGILIALGITLYDIANSAERG